MIRSIPRAVTAAVLAVSLALGSFGASATPARADNQDAVRIIGGLIALYAIGRALEGASRPPSRDVHVVPPPRHRPTLVAPGRCQVEGRDRHGVFRGYERRCMLRHADYPRLLPDDCLRRVRIRHDDVVIYGGRCLAQYGWVPERPRRH